MADDAKAENRPFLEGRWKLLVGSSDLSAQVVSGSVTEAIGEMPTAEFVVRSDALALGVDYRAEVEVEMEYEQETVHLLTGQVKTIDLQGDTALVTLVGGMPEAYEQGMASFSTRRIGHPEIVWSIFRRLGIEAQDIRVQDFTGGPVEIFEVVCKISGVNLSRAVHVGAVTFAPFERVAHLLNDITPSDHAEWFSPPPECIAHALVRSGTVFEAERTGLAHIDAALAWIALRMNYSFSTGPDGTTRPYRREWTVAQVDRQEAIIVHGTTSKRRWVRSGGDIFFRPDLDLAEVPRVEQVCEEPAGPQQVVEAIRSLARATKSSDSIAAIGALWESLEFYTAGVKAPNLFTQAELAALRACLTQDLTPDQRARINDVVSRVNDAPLMVRLALAIEEDGVPINAGEMQLLTRLRRFRNDFIHGRERGTASEADVRTAMAIVDRMLTYRVDRLTRAPKRRGSTIREARALIGEAL